LAIFSAHFFVNRSNNWFLLPNDSLKEYFWREGNIFFFKYEVGIGILTSKMRNNLIGNGTPVKTITQPQGQDPFLVTLKAA
jgi:hypothetical protein